MTQVSFIHNILAIVDLQKEE